MTKEVPFEKDWRHWKEKYEMEVRARETDKSRWIETVKAWNQHSFILSAALSAFLPKSR